MVYKRIDRMQNMHKRTAQKKLVYERYYYYH